MDPELLEAFQKWMIKKYGVQKCKKFKEIQVRDLPFSDTFAVDFASAGKTFRYLFQGDGVVLFCTFPLGSGSSVEGEHPMT